MRGDDAHPFGADAGAAVLELRRPGDGRFDELEATVAAQTIAIGRVTALAAMLADHVRAGAFLLRALLEEGQDSIDLEAVRARALGHLTGEAADEAVDDMLRWYLGEQRAPPPLAH